MKLIEFLHRTPDTDGQYTRLVPYTTNEEALDLIRQRQMELASPADAELLKSDPAGEHHKYPEDIIHGEKYNYYPVSEDMLNQGEDFVILASRSRNYGLYEEAGFRLWEINA